MSKGSVLLASNTAYIIPRLTGQLLAFGYSCYVDLVHPLFTGSGKRTQIAFGGMYLIQPWHAGC